MQVAVAGVTGFLGRHFLRHARELGIQLKGLTRNEPSDPSLFGSLVIRDILDLEPADVDGCDAIVNFAMPTGQASAGMAVSVATHLLELAHEARISRFIHVGSLSAYGATTKRGPGQANGANLERQPWRRGSYAEAKTLSDLAVQTLACSIGSPPAVAVVRPGLVYASDMKAGVLTGTAIQLPAGIALGLGKPKHRVPAVHVNDLMRALLRLLALPQGAALQVWDIVHPDPFTKADFVRYFNRLTGRTPRQLWVPKVLALVAAHCVEAGSRMRGIRTDYPYKVKRLYGFDPGSLDAVSFWSKIGTPPIHNPLSMLENATSMPRDASVPQSPETSTIGQLHSLLEASRGVNKPSPIKRRLIIVGAGRAVGELHVPALLGLPCYEVRAVVDPNLDLAARIASFLPGAGAISSIDELDDVDSTGSSAVIATPGFTHFSIAEALIERGFDLLIEKPVVIERDHFNRLLQLQKESGRAITAFHNYRLRPNSLKLFQFLANHRPGALLRAALTFHSRRIQEEQAGWSHAEVLRRTLVMELGIHFLDLLFLLAGQPTTWGDVLVTRNQDATITLGVDAIGSTKNLTHLIIDLDLTGTSLRANLTFDFERTSCALDFFPDGFRVLPNRRNPIDDLVYSVSQSWQFFGNRVLRGSSVRMKPHRQIYLDHMSQVRGDGGGAFSLDTVSATMHALFDFCDRVYASSE